MAPISGSDSPSALHRLSLEAFERAADDAGKDAFIEINGDRLEVLAHGRMPQGGRAVAWVVSGADSGIARVFSAALAERFGGAVADKVAHELGLAGHAGKAIESRMVHQAIDMAHTASTALEGQQFAVVLTHGAVANSASFTSAARALGIVPDHIDSAQRNEIDVRFARLLTHESATPDTPTCVRLLGQAMREVLVGDAAQS